MVKVYFTKSFIKKSGSFPRDLQEEILEKIELFKNRDNHKSLKVHKLHGKYKNEYSFYINYKIRIIFTWENHNEAILMTVGGHDMYE